MIKLFISYAHEDEGYKNELEKHLITYKRNGTIESWDDREILPGKEWEEEIRHQIENSQLILFLISPDFISSEYINDVELKKAFDRYRKREVMMIPIIIRPADFSSLEISKFQALPKDGRPISTWEDKDEAWLDVVKQLKKVFKSLNDDNLKLKKSAPANPPNQMDENEVQNTKQEVIDKITNGQTEDAIKILLKSSKESNNSDLYNQVIMLSARFNNLKRSKSTGIISDGDSQRSLAQINNSVLYILDDFE